MTGKADTPGPRLADDCFAGPQKLLRAEEALAAILGAAVTVAEREEVPVEEAGGRVLAEEIAAPQDVPAFDNAAVDGYAFAHASLAEPGPTRLAVAGRAAAGHPFEGAVRLGEAVQILTGAMVPEGADTIVMQEDVETADGHVIVPAGVKPGANRRRKGEDVKAGSVILGPGHRMRPQDVGAAVSLGRGRLKVRRRLRVAIFSTGDEIVPPGADLPPGQVYDANRPILRALLAPLGVGLIDLGVLRDERGRVQAALEDAAARADLILTTGGASKGAEDHVMASVEAIGKLHAWQLAIKPGRPLGMGQIGDTVFVGLPGNPVAAIVCFLMFVQPLMARLQGETWRPPLRVRVPARFEMKKKPGRREYLRGIGVREADGTLTGVAKFPRDGSGILTSLREADGLIEVAEETTRIAEGDLVTFLPFHAPGLM
ncbi:MAG: molybdopterin molybdotransferase MoeA [Alphaproteobacteria bacterium]|nr:molybdopterin molybdotransferase MoeA [Alphaproteobacteria bacterium]MDX5369523.1 molybdopterin molybdotransferase MoeA [Alphaproteobacteria bacterium]MDX5464181.1 molybdopterin molybdotransferase MoeA [Alphaproteobacteria bacterium]